jgi:hypothetical protein
MIARVAATLWCAGAAAIAQPFSQRGFFEDLTTFYPRTAPNDSAHVVSEVLFRYEASYQPVSWLKLNGALDARTDTHRQVERQWDFTVDDRTVRRPAFALRRFSAILNKNQWTVELGRQFIRWGRADILNPVDHFAPKDFLNVVNTDFLGVIATRVTYESGSNTVDLVWQPWFTPSRTPLLNQRWTVLPDAIAGIPIRDNGAEYPSRSQFGARWNHVGAGYEFAASYFDGYNHLPLFRAAPEYTPVFDVAVERYYPRLRLYGADAAVPTRWATVKMEAAYFTTEHAQTDEYLLYVLQLERQQANWVFVGGYAGEMVTAPVGNPLQFSPERGFARSFLGRAEYTLGPARSLAFTGAARQNGRGTWLRFEYSQMYGRHWRATGGITWIHGASTDFLGEYYRNSYASLALRYSF